MMFPVSGQTTTNFQDVRRQRAARKAGTNINLAGYANTNQSLAAAYAPMMFFEGGHPG